MPDDPDPLPSAEDEKSATPEEDKDARIEQLPAEHIQSASENVAQRDQESSASEPKKYKTIDFDAVFAQVEKESEEMSQEEYEAKHPWLKCWPAAKTATPLEVADFLEELYEEMAREAENED